MSKSPHILSTASNLLGFCLIVLTSIKVFGKSAGTIIDEIDAIAILLFLSSCIFSFLSIRKGDEKGQRLEQIADIIFLAGLACLSIITILFIFKSFD
ncbi:MAG: hypothetical protein JST68_13210 [Bacteroidetes bacterium]|nr:hypothetical protein [Bacteroidota bacterium]